MRCLLVSVAHALVRAASALLPTLGEACEKWCREESRHGTHQCVRHVGLLQHRWLLAAFGAALCAAQPMITDLQPRGVQKGRPFTLTVVGQDLAEGAKVESTLPATFTALGAEKGVMGASFLVEPSAEMAVGVYPIRVVTPDGISNIQLFSVGAFPEYTEDESRPGALPNSNDTIETAQPLPAGALTVNGKLRGPERDVFRIEAKRGDRRVLEVEARRCGSAIDPVIDVEDASGKVLARSEDAALLGLDARVEVTFPKDGYYYVVVHDARYSTQKANFYRLNIGSYPFPGDVFPLGGRRGETVQVTLGSHKITADLRNAGRDTRQVFINLPDSPILPIPFAVGDDPEVTDPGPQALTLPVTINGRLSKPGKTDRYTLQVTPGEPLTIRMQARELGTSKLMAVLSVFDQKGVTLGRAGDEPLAEDVYDVSQSRTVGDPELRVKAPADAHTLVVAVEDLALRGGPGYAYRLNVRRGAQDIRLVLNTPYVNVPAGGSAAVPVIVERHGYDGDVHMRVPNAPQGLRVEGGYVVAVPPMKDGENTRTRSSIGILILSAEPGANIPASQLTVEGVADLTGGSQLIRRAEGPGMMVGVSGAKEQGAVDRQRTLTAPWLGLQLPMAATKPQAATLEVAMVERKRMAEGDQIQFRWKWMPRDPLQELPKTVDADMVGAADIRLIDARAETPERTTGTFLITTTKLTRPGKYDLYVTGQLKVDGQEQEVVSRPISVEVQEVEPPSAAKTNSDK